MALSPNGGIFNGVDLNAVGTFFTVKTLVANATGNYGSAANNQRNLLKLMETVQGAVNVKYINVTSATVDLSDSAIRTANGFGTDYNQAATTVYTIKFFAEQTNYLTAASLATAINGVTAVVANPTTAVPITGPSTRTLSTYDTAGAATKNTVIVAANNF